MLYKNQDWSDYLLKGILGLIVIGLVGAVIAIGVVFYEDHVDTEGTPMIEGVGTVVLRTHIPARWQPVITGRTISGYWVPDHYLIRVEYDGWISSRSVSATYYDSVTIGQHINICYQIGRSGRHYLRCVY
jgi:hypothetical protein